MPQYDIVLIGIGGKAGAGKSTAQHMLELMLPKHYKPCCFNFADEVKRVARDFFGWNGVKDEAGRRLLQAIGQWGRSIDPNFWIRAWWELVIDAYRAEPLAIIAADVRFPIELDIFNPWATKHRGLTSRLNWDAMNYARFSLMVTGRGGLTGDVAADVSENSVTPDMFTNTIDNSASAGELRQSLRSLIERNEIT